MTVTGPQIPLLGAFSIGPLCQTLSNSEAWAISIVANLSLQFDDDVHCGHTDRWAFGNTDRWAFGNTDRWAFGTTDR